MGHVLMVNRHGLIITPRFTESTETAEWEATERMVGDAPGRHRITVGVDKVYRTREFVQSLCVLKKPCVTWPISTACPRWPEDREPLGKYFVGLVTIFRRNRGWSDGNRQGYR